MKRDRFGLVWIDHHLGYGVRKGALQWAPEFVQDAIVTGANWVLCRTLGHDLMRYEINVFDPLSGKTICTACGKLIGAKP